MKDAFVHSLRFYPNVVNPTASLHRSQLYLIIICFYNVRGHIFANIFLSCVCVCVCVRVCVLTMRNIFCVFSFSPVDFDSERYSLYFLFVPRTPHIRAYSHTRNTEIILILLWGISRTAFPSGARDNRETERWRTGRGSRHRDRPRSGASSRTGADSLCLAIVKRREAFYLVRYFSARVRIRTHPSTHTLPFSGPLSCSPSLVLFPTQQVGRCFRHGA